MSGALSFVLAYAAVTAAITSLIEITSRIVQRN